jgi:hypothetical protein
MTTFGINFVLQWGSTTAISRVWGHSSVVPKLNSVVYSFQVTPRSTGGISGGVTRASLFFNEWARAHSLKVFSTRSFKKWITLTCLSTQPRWADKVYLQGRSLHGHAREIRYLTRPRSTNIFGGNKLTLRGTHTWKNPWCLILWGEVQLNRPRYV